MIDIKSGILPKCSRCLLPIKENEMVRLTYSGWPEDSHIDVAEAKQLATERFEVLVHEAKLILCRHCCKGLY